jgi:hypothetical protein
MADVPNREPKEEELEAILALIWREWSKVDDPSELTVDKLQELLRSNAMEPLWAVWVTANLNLVEEYGAKQNESNLAAAFLLFFNNWSRDLSDRWSSRVAQWREEWTQQQQPAPTTTTRIPTIGQPLPVLGQETKPKEPVPPWKDAKETIVQPHDTKREAITTITETQTNGETDGARKVEQQGTPLIAVWRTEPGACEICAELEGTYPQYWKQVAFNGPPVHPNCRCRLSWEPYVR